jgi:hypothetical protein
MKVHYCFFLAVLLSGCATRFSEFSPSTFSYKSSSTVDSLEYSLCFNILEKTGNTRYSKIEKKKNLELVAVRVVNHSSSPLMLTEENFKFLSGGFNIVYVTPEDYYLQVKRHPGYYFFWLFANPSYTKTTVTSGGYGSPHVNQKIIVIPLGIPIAIYNYALARNSNNHFRKNLQEYALLKKTLQPEEIVYGYIFSRKPINKDWVLQKK